MAVTNFIEFLQEFTDATLSNEDKVIEIGASFNIESQLPAINHGYRITIKSIDGFWQVGVENLVSHFIIVKGILILETISLVGNVNSSMVVSEGGIEVGNHGQLILDNSEISYIKTENPAPIWILRNGKATFNGATIKNCSGSIAGAVLIEEGGQLLIDYNSVIQDCENQSKENSAQIITYGDLTIFNATLTFTYSSISYNIIITEQGLCELFGGEISKALVGINLTSGSRFIYNEGIIEENEIGILTEAIGSHKYIEMTGGEIRNNRIGMSLNEGTITNISSGKIHSHLGNDGIGILITYGTTGSLNITGGEIYRNIQGISIQQSNIEVSIKGNTKIYENGFGILIDHSVVTVEGGEIYNNLMPLHNYPYAGIGIYIGFRGILNLRGSIIYGNEYYGIFAQYNATVNINEGKIYENGMCGIHLDQSKLFMNGGHIFKNGGCGVSLDSHKMEEDIGSYIKVDGGNIYENEADGIHVMGISTCDIYEGRIRNNKRMGILSHHLTVSNIYGGEIYGNYHGIYLEGIPQNPIKAKANISGGKIFENVIGVFSGINSSFIMDGGEIYSNSGLLDSMKEIPDAVHGGIGIAISQGTVKMNGGRIYNHIGFNSNQCYAVGSDLLGAGVTIISPGSFEMIRGEIVNNSAPAGAAIYIPGMIYTPLIIHAESYFNCNKSTEMYAFHYGGGNQHVDTFINFAHTSVGCHILNNYDVNFTNSLPLLMKYLNYFPDPNFAKLICEQLDRECDAYIDQCEFSNITKLNADNLGIFSIEGAQFLMNLDEISLNENHVIDIGPLGYKKFVFNQETPSRNVIYQAHSQYRFLPEIYVSKKQNLVINNAVTEVINYTVEPTPVTIEINEPAGTNQIYIVPTFFYTVPLDSDQQAYFEIRIPNVTCNYIIPSIEEPFTEVHTLPYEIAIILKKDDIIIGQQEIIHRPANSAWFELINENSIDLLVGNLPERQLQLIASKFIIPTIFKYNGSYYPKELPYQVWWEAGRNVTKWESDNFDGSIIQRAIPIPINVLFPNNEIAKRVANILKKNTEDTIDITELKRITMLDLSSPPDNPLEFINEIQDLEGLQFFPNLQILNLKRTGATMSMVNEFLTASSVDEFVHDFKILL